MEHGHAHAGHTHDHSHAHAAGAASLRLAFLINLAFTVVEAFGGWWTGSIAVLTDALHDAGDSLVLGTAWYLQRVAMKGRDARYSYGYGRYSMLGGWLTSLVLLFGALMMMVVSVPRIRQGSSPDADRMVLIAIFGLVMNALAARMLHGGHSLNERGAYLHLLEDVLGWAAVLIGAVVIRYTGWVVIDPLLSIGISLFIGFNAIRMLRRGTAILMQGTPRTLDTEAVRRRLLAIPHVRDLHDQHVWTLDGDLAVLTVHLVVDDIGLPEARQVKADAREALHAMGIHHATIELEWASEHCGLKDH